MALGPISTLDGAPAIEMRVCAKCKQRLPATEENFYKHKVGTHAGKFFTWCKKCHSKNSSEYHILKSGRKKVIKKSVDMPSDLPIGEDGEIEKKPIGVHKKKTPFAPEQILDLCKNTVKVLFDQNPVQKYGKEFDAIYENAMNQLERVLIRSMVVQAVGFPYEEERIIYVRSTVDGGWAATEKQITKKYQSGNAQLFILLLTNKFPDRWKVSRELLTGKTETYDNKPGQRNRKLIEAIGKDVLAENTDRPEAEHPVQG